MINETNEDQYLREKSLLLFQAYMAQALEAEIPQDITATMAISASLFALVAKHGIDDVAEFVEELKSNIKQGNFSPMSALS